MEATAAPTNDFPPLELAGRVIGAIVLILLSALFSGLTLGILGLDLNELEIVKEAGSADDKRCAKIIAPVRAQGNLLLCTLVLGNVSVTSLTSILLADMTSGAVGFVVSTLAIVIFGEIIPQAICSRYALVIGARAVPIVRVLIFLFYPLTKPLAFLLDYCLGKELGTFYSRTEFEKLIKIHVESNHLVSTEASIIQGALTFRSKTVAQVMTPLDSVFSVFASDRLDAALLRRIFHAGYSRTPVFEDSTCSTVCGLLYAKDLVMVTPEHAHPVISVVHLFGRERVTVVDAADNLESVLKLFLSTRVPFAVVRDVVEAVEGHDPLYKITGVITMKDVLSEVLGDKDNAYDDDLDLARAAPQSVREERLAQEGAVASLFAPTHEAATVTAAAAATSSSTLAHSEVTAMAAHLITNTPAFRKRFTFGAMVELVRSSAVVSLSEGAALPVDGVCVILQGTVSAAPGEGDDRKEAAVAAAGGGFAPLSQMLTVGGPWDVLNSCLVPRASALPTIVTGSSSSRNSIVTDVAAPARAMAYTATSATVRFLRIDVANVMRCLTLDTSAMSISQQGPVSPKSPVHKKTSLRGMPSSPQTTSVLDAASPTTPPASLDAISVTIAGARELSVLPLSGRDPPIFALEDGSSSNSNSNSNAMGHRAVVRVRSSNAPSAAAVSPPAAAVVVFAEGGAGGGASPVRLLLPQGTSSSEGGNTDTRVVVQQQP